MGERLAARGAGRGRPRAADPRLGHAGRDRLLARDAGSRSAKGLIKNRYVGRTFIQPDQGLREQGIRLKFNPLAEVAGKRVVVVDDSIVRGNTTRQIVAMLFDAGATEVHVRVSSPPVDRPVLLRHRPRRRGRADRADAHGRGGARAHRRDLARLPLARGPPGVDARGRSRRSAAPASRGDYPTRIPRDGAAKLRFEPALPARPATARGRGSPSRSRG